MNLMKYHKYIAWGMLISLALCMLGLVLSQELHEIAGVCFLIFAALHIFMFRKNLKR